MISIHEKTIYKKSTTNIAKNKKDVVLTVTEFFIVDNDNIPEFLEIQKKDRQQIGYKIRYEELGGFDSQELKQLYDAIGQDIKEHATKPLKGVKIMLQDKILNIDLNIN